MSLLITKIGCMLEPCSFGFLGTQGTTNSAVRASLLMNQKKIQKSMAPWVLSPNFERCVSICVCVQVNATKAELSELGDGIEEIRGVCRQLQTQLRKIPECLDAAFEIEADTLMDRWLDVSLPST